MSGGRTIWWPKDTAWHRRERIVDLGEEFGPVGPLIIDWLSCEAKIQDASGHVKSGVKSVARGCFTDAVTVGRVLSRAVAIGQLEDYTEDDGRFECRISGWQADNERGAGTLRKREQRAQAAGENGSVEPDQPQDTTGPAATEQDLSRSVSGSPLRVEESRETEERQVSPRADVLELSNRLADAIRGNDPKAKVKPDSKGWLDPIRLLLDTDERTAEEVGRVIDFCQADDFERRNVLSPAKLRKRFTSLLLKADGEGAQPEARFGDEGTRRPRREFPRFAAANATPSAATVEDCTSTDELAATWGRVEAVLRSVVEDPAAWAYLSKLHLHVLTDEEAVIGCMPETVSWVTGRFGRVIGAAVERVVDGDRAVRLVGCRAAREERAA